MATNSHRHFVHVEIASLLVFQTFDRIIFSTLAFPGTKCYALTVWAPRMVGDQKKLETTALTSARASIALFERLRACARRTLSAKATPKIAGILAYSRLVFAVKYSRNIPSVSQDWWFWHRVSNRRALAVTSAVAGATTTWIFFAETFRSFVS